MLSKNGKNTMIERKDLPYPIRILKSGMKGSQMGLDWHKSLNGKGWFLLIAAQIVASEYKRTD